METKYYILTKIEGEYAYLNQGTKVTNALMTTQKMSQMVNSRVDTRFANIDKRLDRLCTIIERNGINTSSNINVEMHDMTFNNENDAKRK